MKKIIIIGGGTFSFVRNHLALAAPAFGETALNLAEIADTRWGDEDICLYLTQMADSQNMWGEQTGHICTNEDVMEYVQEWKSDANVKVIFFNVAMCDYEGLIDAGNGVEYTLSGKYEPRLKTSDGDQIMYLHPVEKVISSIREGRKDIFLVGFKTTCGATEDEMYVQGLGMLKKSSCNLVLANDTKTRKNMIITPEEARYCVTEDRTKVLEELVDMAYLRSQLLNEAVNEAISSLEPVQKEIEEPVKV